MPFCHTFYRYIEGHLNLSVLQLHGKLVDSVNINKKSKSTNYEKRN